jgi:putative PIN family toxin of toxin-antitoxin system
LKGDKVLKAVFDTNIYLSALITKGGRAEQAWLLAVEGEIDVYTSVPIMTELAGKLREKFHWDDSRIKAAVRHVTRIAEVVKPDIELKIPADNPDNRILECAQCAGAEFIVTGDKHLLNLALFEGIRIMNQSEILEILCLSSC